MGRDNGTGATGASGCGGILLTEEHKDKRHKARTPQTRLSPEAAVRNAMQWTSHQALTCHVVGAVHVQYIVDYVF